ncbi:MAG: ATP-binding protein, partial [Caldilineaceae bacterium]|nr:ATP-binding protein [Caldilineaceae bacterium]
LALRLNRAITRVTGALQDIAVGAPPPTLPETDVAEIDTLYRAVNTLVARLTALEDARRRMLANLVHELGRPLGSLQAAVQALRQGAVNAPPLRDELLAGMDDQLTRMQPLLDDLTELHGHVLGTLTLNRQPTPLRPWLMQTTSLWRLAAEQKGLRWRVDIPLDLPTAALDQDQMARALGNLISNAIKYTPDGGHIAVVVCCDQEPTFIRFQVSDTGIGMNHDELVQNLGTIAHSGAKDFIREAKEEKVALEDIIGQFGVGFYSVFMAAKEVTVTTRSYRPDDRAWTWRSTGDSSYTVEPADKATRGTDIRVTLKDDAKEFASGWRLEQIIKQHSDYVSFPIYVVDANAETE